MNYTGDAVWYLYWLYIVWGKLAISSLASNWHGMDRIYSNQYKPGHFFNTFKSRAYGTSHHKSAMFCCSIQCPKHSRVSPNIIPVKKLSCSNQRPIQTVQKLSSLWTARTMCQNLVHSQTDSLQYLNTARRQMCTSCYLYLVQTNARRTRSHSGWQKSRMMRSCLLADLCWAVY